jgi:hypothetical protein
VEEAHGAKRGASHRLSAGSLHDGSPEQKPYAEGDLMTDETTVTGTVGSEPVATGDVLVSAISYDQYFPSAYFATLAMVGHPEGGEFRMQLSKDVALALQPGQRYRILIVPTDEAGAT